MQLIKRVGVLERSVGSYRERYDALTRTAEDATKQLKQLTVAGGFWDPLLNIPPSAAVLASCPPGFVRSARAGFTEGKSMTLFALQYLGTDEREYVASFLYLSFLLVFTVWWLWMDGGAGRQGWYRKTGSPTWASSCRCSRDA